MLTRSFFVLTNNVPGVRQVLFRSLFEYLARKTRDANGWTQMNYGYAGDTNNGYTVALHSDEEGERYCHQLYHHLTEGTDLTDKDVLEVSSGRGGGAVFVHRHMRPRTMTGVDIARAAVEFCRRRYHQPGLRFLHGDAEDLPLTDGSVDVVINVEASFCYPDFRRFLAEVRRVLRPGGSFLFADLRLSHELPDLDRALTESGLQLTVREEITANVVRALELDGARREDLKPYGISPFLRHAVRSFTGARGTRIPTKLAKGELRYFRFVLKKPASNEIKAGRSQISTTST